jgi:hypothetical protein
MNIFIIFIIIFFLKLEKYEVQDPCQIKITIEFIFFLKLSQTQKLLDIVERFMKIAQISNTY